MPARSAWREIELLRDLRDEDTPIRTRRALLRDLRNIGTGLSVGVLRECINDPDFGVEMGAIRALGCVDSEAADEILIERLDGRPGLCLGVAARELGVRGSRQAVPALVRCMERTDIRKGDRRTIALALGKMPHAKSVPVLATAAHGWGYRMRNAAAWSLAQIDAAESRTALEDIVHQLSWYRSIAARRALRLRRARGLDH
jgi:HEAT repeat protein